METAQMNENISVVIPLFNKEKHIARALQSALNQTRQAFEIIVIDDGSTDQSADVVRSFTDSRIKMIAQKNGGVSSARNRGIEEAKSELIAFLDADDAYKPNFLEMILALKKQYPDAGAYATNYEIIENHGRVRLGARPLKENLYTLDVNNYFKTAIYGTPVWSSAVAIKKIVFEQVGGFPLGVKLGEDLDMWIRILFSFPVIFDSRVGATYFNDATFRACVQSLPDREPYFFKTIDSLCAARPVSPETANDIREFKNLFILMHAKRLITEVSPYKGREVLWAFKSKFFWRQKWEWILKSYVPRDIYYFLKAISRVSQK